MTPNLCMDAFALRQDIITARACGRVTIEFFEPVLSSTFPQPVQVGDEMLLKVRFRPLGHDWGFTSRARALAIATALLNRDLAHNRPIMPEERARDLADRFCAMFPTKSDFLSNALAIDLETWTGDWNPVSDATFDAGIVGVYGNYGGMLWVEDEQ